MNKIISIILILAFPFLSIANIKRVESSDLNEINQVKFLKQAPNIGILATNKGIFKTTNHGDSWKDISGNLPYNNGKYRDCPKGMSCGRIAKNFATNDGNTIYTIMPTPTTGDNGLVSLFLTTDGGIKWKHIAFPSPEIGGYIKLNKNNDLFIYNLRCLYKTNIVSNKFNLISCPDVDEMNFVNDQLVYTSPSRHNPTGGILKSTNSGESWVESAAVDSASRVRAPIFSGFENNLYMVNFYSYISNDRRTHYRYNIHNSIDHARSFNLIYDKDSDRYDGVTSLSSGESGTFFGTHSGKIFNVDEGNFVSRIDTNINRNDITSLFSLNNILWYGTKDGLYSLDLTTKRNPEVSFGLYNGSDMPNVYLHKKTGDIYLYSHRYPSNLGVFPRLVKSDRLLNNYINIPLKELPADEMIINSIFIDKQYNIYLQIMSASTNNKGSIVKSTDNGATWRVIHSSNNFMRCSTNAEMVVSKDRFYCVYGSYAWYQIMKNDDLKKYLLKVNNEETIADFVDEDNIIALTRSGVFSSNDGGISWRKKSDLNHLCSTDAKDLIANPINKIIYLNENEFMLVTNTGILNPLCSDSDNIKRGVFHIKVNDDNKMDVSLSHKSSGTFIKLIKNMNGRILMYDDKDKSFFISNNNSYSWIELKKYSSLKLWPNKILYSGNYIYFRMFQNGPFNKGFYIMTDH